MSISLREVQPHEIEDVIHFVRQARAVMFPMLDPQKLPQDLQYFADTYLTPHRSRFFIARHAEQLIGVIGFVPYDGRFSQLDYSGRNAVEVVRLFIDPAFRRLGLAVQLFDALKSAAKEQGVDLLYLHTHPFLRGAIDFWQRQGFAIVDVEDDPLWRTTHMKCDL